MPSLRPTVLRSLCLAIMLNQKTIAADTLLDIDIPAQSLSSALQQLANQGHLQVLFDGPSVQGKGSSGVTGRYTAQQALQQLLHGSGLQYQFTNDSTVAIKASTGNPGQADSTTLPAVKVVGNAVYDVTDPYNPDYVIPNATAGTKTDTPTMETPLNVQVISKQVMKDQQVISLDQALKNVSGVTTNGSAGQEGGFFGGTGQSIILRGFESQTYFRNGFRLQQGASSREMANVESVEPLAKLSTVRKNRLHHQSMVADF